MGMFNVPVRISNPSGGNETEFDALVDIGAFLTMAPEAALRELGLTPTRTVEFELADGSVVAYGVGEARAAIDGRSVTTRLVFGPDDVEPVLGAYTLEGLELAVNPVDESLIPIRRPRL